MQRILIIEDETPMRTALADLLAGEGYRALTAADGASGLERTLAEKPDLILLDVMMPRLDGFAVCAELRRLSNAVPVLLLTAKGQIEDRVNGLDAGADDYLVKPFSTDELLARVRALLRRVERKTKSAVKIKLGDVEIDLARQTAMRGKKLIRLTAKEFSMLRLMAAAEGEPVSREKFLDAVWGYTTFPTTRNSSNVVDCARDVPVQFGDVIEIPEAVHALNANTPNPVREMEVFAMSFSERLKVSAPNMSPYRTTAECLQKSVQLVVAGATTTFKVNSWKEGFLSQTLAKTEARSALRSSSDLSRVTVTRKSGNSAKPVIFTVDVSDSSKSHDDLWLQEGDGIEVPENRQ